MERFEVENPRYNSQRNNKISPYYTCFPTSVAMTVRTLENQVKGKKRSEILRDDLDDVIIANIENNLSKWKAVALKLGSWTKSIHPRTIYKFYEYWFPEAGIITGYKATYASMNQFQIKEWISKNNTPMIIGTKFTHGGHIVTIIGFDDPMGYFIVNDPYGDVNTNYISQEGKGIKVLYTDKKWCGSGDPTTTKYHCLLIERT